MLSHTGEKRTSVMELALISLAKTAKFFVFCFFFWVLVLVFFPLNTLTFDDEIAHQCAQCQRRFSVLSNLKRHQMTCGRTRRKHQQASSPDARENGRNADRSPILGNDNIASNILEALKDLPSVGVRYSAPGELVPLSHDRSAT